jgi:predicted GNAT superfamily acetyltransferase
MEAVEFRRATPEDYDAILQLQSANYIGNLSLEQRREGFLSAQFTREQVAALAEDLGTTIAVVDGDLAGCLCAIRRDFDHRSPVVAKMLDCFDHVSFNGKPLSSINSYIYGPVCIGRRYRGRGLLRGLYDVQRRDLSGRFDAGVALISRDNPHSLQAHRSGLGMSEVGEFEVQGNIYAILAFAVYGK